MKLSNLSKGGEKYHVFLSLSRLNLTFFLECIVKLYTKLSILILIGYFYVKLEIIIVLDKTKKLIFSVLSQIFLFSFLLLQNILLPTNYEFKLRLLNQSCSKLNGSETPFIRLGQKISLKQQRRAHEPIKNQNIILETVTYLKLQ